MLSRIDYCLPLIEKGCTEKELSRQKGCKVGSSQALNESAFFAGLKIIHAGVLF